MAEKKLATGTTRDDPQTQPLSPEQVQDDLQAENAETSLDQPSESIG
jgi:hypothetical protein